MPSPTSSLSSLLLFVSLFLLANARIASPALALAQPTPIVIANVALETHQNLDLPDHHRLRGTQTGITGCQDEQVRFFRQQRGSSSSIGTSPTNESNGSIENVAVTGAAKGETVQSFCSPQLASSFGCPRIAWRWFCLRFDGILPSITFYFQVPTPHTSSTLRKYIPIRLPSINRCLRLTHSPPSSLTQQVQSPRTKRVGPRTPIPPHHPSPPYLYSTTSIMNLPSTATSYTDDITPPPYIVVGW